MEEKRDSFYDKAYKSLFSHPQMVEDLIRDFVQETWVNELDFKTLEKVGTSYITQDRKERETDVVYKVNYGQNELYIYILIEFQSSVEKYMSLRVLIYILLFYEDLLKQKKVQDKLPFVFPIVLYNGDSKWTAPVEISELIQTPAEDLKKYLVNFSYNLISVNALDMDALAELKDAVSTLFFLENSKGEDFDKHIERIGAAIYSLVDKDLRRELFSFLFGFIRRKKYNNVDLEKIDIPEVKTMLRTSMEEYKKELEAKASSKAKKEREIEIARNMLRKGYKAEDVMELTGLSDVEIEKIELD